MHKLQTLIYFSFYVREQESSCRLGRKKYLNNLHEIFTQSEILIHFLCWKKKFSRNDAARCK